MIRHASIWLLIMAAACTAYGQGRHATFHSDFERQAFAHKSPLAILLASDASIDSIKYTAYERDILTLKEKLDKRRDKLSQKQFLELIYTKVHSKKLHWYENYVTLSDLLDKGLYDCLTGTAMYALLLEAFEIPYTIHEFDFHVLLMAYTDTDSVLIESTDPYYGFITKAENMTTHLNQYTQGTSDSPQSNASIGNLPSTVASSVHDRISIDDLLGLQYYNLAINAYNHGKVYDARVYINKASLLYPSNRIKETREFFFSTMPVSYVSE